MNSPLPSNPGDTRVVVELSVYDRLEPTVLVARKGILLDPGEMKAISWTSPDRPLEEGQFDPKTETSRSERLVPSPVHLEGE